MNYLNLSSYTSLGVQFATGLFEAQGLFFKVEPKDEIVKEILGVELIVQVIEFLFYVYLVYSILNDHLANKITSHRYFDWFITTPIMLINFIVLFKYLKNPAEKKTWVNSVKEDIPTILKIVGANAVMLLFGFLAETSQIDRYLGVALGFLPFAYMFKILYADYVKTNQLATTIFYFSFIIWGFYGVAAVLPFASKNIMYNILDLFAKNAYGLFLYFFLLYKRV